MNQLERLITWIKGIALPGVELLEFEPMSRHTSFRIGGPVRAMVVVSGNPLEAAPLLKQCCELGVRPLFMGNGTDLLAPDEGLDCLAIKTVSSTMSQDGTLISIQSGAAMTRLANFALEHELTGLEFAHGIPGSVGGGLTMNAGAYGGELKERVHSVTVLDRCGICHTYDNEACQFTYRHSAFSDGEWYIASAVFQLASAQRADIKATMDDLAAKRREKQPLDYPSAGSTFKRPEGHFAAALIDECGLKGCRVGGAQVSEKHAGFVVNVGGATSRDVRALMEQITATVQARTGITLEPEVKIL